jgi:hypothetical protein
MNRSKPILFLISMLLLDTYRGIAQSEPDVKRNAWLEIGSLKFAPTKKESSAGVDIVMKFQKNKLLTTIQYHDYVDRELAHGGFELFTSSNHYHAGNFMLGITNRKCRYGHVSLSSGLGIFWGRFDDIGVEKFKTIGWPIEAAASLNICAFVGVNLKVFTNINTKHSLIGFGMDLQLGKLRKINLNKILQNRHTAIRLT